MGKIMAVLNEKGGVGKTTTVKDLAVGLARQGKRILTVDLDPSANLTTSCGLYRIDEETASISDLFRLAEKCEEIPKGLGIYRHEEGIDLIPSTAAFHNYEAILQYAVQKEIVLRRILFPHKTEYDYIFIDCPAGLGLFVTNAMFAADALIVPVQPQFLGATAMQNLFGYINMVRRLNGTGTKPELAGILFTMVKTNVNNDTAVENHFRESYKDKYPIYDTHIPNSVRFSESDAAGASIYKYAPKSASAFAYSKLVEEFIRREEV